MAKLRSASAYRRIKRPYTRVSRSRSKSYVKGAPGFRIVHYDMGNKGKEFSHEIQIISKKEIQVRDNALEAARQVLVRHLEAKAGKDNYWVKVRAVPHHVLRENPLATGAGADRFQQGMRLAFGKPIGHAAQVKPGKVLFSIYVDEQHVDIAKKIAKKATAKLPMPCAIEVVSS